MGMAVFVSFSFYEDLVFTDHHPPQKKLDLPPSKFFLDSSQKKIWTAKGLQSNGKWGSQQGLTSNIRTSQLKD